MRARSITLVAVLGILGAGIATAGGASATQGSGPNATASQDRAKLAFKGIAVRTQTTVRLRRRAVIAGWRVANTSQVDATKAVTCVQLPPGFRIDYGAAINRPQGLKVTGRKACIKIGTVYVASNFGTQVEGHFPRTPGSYKLKFTATANNADTITKIVTLRVRRG